MAKKRKSKSPDKKKLNSDYTIQEALDIRETKRSAFYHGEKRS